MGLNAHVKHKPPRADDSNYLPYIGNGHFGLSDSGSEQELFISASGLTRTLTVPVNFKPVVHISNSEFEDNQSAKVVNYVKGLIHDVICYDDGDEASSKGDISISRQLFAHRGIPEVFVQEVKITNPTGKDHFFRMERLGISNWGSASSTERT